MNRSLIISVIVIIICGLTAFACFQPQDTVPVDKYELVNDAFIFDNDPTGNFNIFYDVTPRFNTTVTKETLHKAHSIADILPEKVTRDISSYRNVRVALLDKDDPRKELGSAPGNNDILNGEQVVLFRKADHSSDIYIRADYTMTNEITGLTQDDYLTYYITVVPETQAYYSDGVDALFDYLRASSAEATKGVKPADLEPGRIRFTITNTGAIDQVSLSSSSGRKAIDSTMLRTIREIPGSWTPASDKEGQAVDQELVFLFGVPGC